MLHSTACAPLTHAESGREESDPGGPDELADGVRDGHRQHSPTTKRATAGAHHAPLRDSDSYSVPHHTDSSDNENQDSGVGTNQRLHHQRRYSPTVIVIRPIVSGGIGNGAGEAFASDGAAGVEKGRLRSSARPVAGCPRLGHPRVSKCAPQCALLEVWAMQAGWAQVKFWSLTKEGGDRCGTRSGSRCWRSWLG